MTGYNEATGQRPPLEYLEYVRDQAATARLDIAYTAIPAAVLPFVRFMPEAIDSGISETSAVTLGTLGGMALLFIGDGVRRLHKARRLDYGNTLAPESAPPLVVRKFRDLFALNDGR